jgi:ClpP class serine protease
MDEILKKLLQSELLSEETRAEISEQWTTSVETFKTQVREEVSGEVRLELAEQWAGERDELISKVDSFVAEALTKEMSELRSDVERFRDLEVEFAEKLVEEKHVLAEEVAKELDGLVDKIDQFFEMRLQAEMDELKEDLQVVKQNEFGRKIFEAFATTFGESYVDEDAIQSKLVVAESKLADAEKVLAEREKELGKMVRESKMEEVLSPLTGKKREQMAMVLRSIETSRLEESYKYFIGRILKEDAVAPEAKVITEGKTVESKTTVVTGEPATIVESKGTTVSSDMATLRRLAGI